MTTSLSPSTRRLLAIALLCLVAVAAESFVVTPWLEQRSLNQQRIVDDTALLLRYERTLAQQRAQLANLRRLGDEGGVPALFLAATTDAVAAAELQTLVRNAATELGASVTSTRVLPTNDGDRPRRVGVAVQLKTEYDPLIRLLHRLESGNPAVRLSAIEIQRTGDTASELAVRMEAYGFLREEKT